MNAPKLVRKRNKVFWQTTDKHLESEVFMLPFPRERMSEGAKVRRLGWHRKEYLMVEDGKFWLVAYGAVKFPYTLTADDVKSKDWEILNE